MQFYSVLDIIKAYLFVTKNANPVAYHRYFKSNNTKNRFCKSVKVCKTPMVLIVKINLFMKTIITPSSHRILVCNQIEDRLI